MTTITQHLTLRRLVPGGVADRIPTDFVYDPAVDPYAVHCSFTCPVTGLPVPWLLSRDLLDAGMAKRVGLHEVMVWPSNEHGPLMVYIQLTRPEGVAVLEVPFCGLRPFLDKTYVVVPYGTEGEHFDLDAELLALTA